jgi:glycosyltransferase involved in cell wall biosynthesis
MRILMILYNQVGHGTYWRALNLGRSLAKRQHQVTLLAMSPKRRLHFDTFVDQGVQVVATPDLLFGALRSGWDLWDSLRRMQWMMNQTYDIVHAFESRPVVIWPALFAQRACHAKLVMDWSDWFGRGGSVEERANPLVRGLLSPVETFFEEHYRQRADGTTVINTTLQQKALTLGVSAESLILLRNGCDVENLKSLSIADARDLLGLAHDASYVGYIGAIFPRDAMLMAKAFDCLQARKPSAQLLVAGYCNLPIERYVSNPETVHRTGHLPYADIGTHLSACDLFWLPLNNTGANRGRWPLKLNDYMSVGRPVITTDVGDLAPFFEEHAIGLAVNDNPAALADATLTLLNNPELRQQMGDHSHHLARTLFTWDALSVHLEMLYERVLQANSLGRAEDPLMTS